ALFLPTARKVALTRSFWPPDIVQATRISWERTKSGMAALCRSTYPRRCFLSAFEIPLPDCFTTYRKRPKKLRAISRDLPGLEEVHRELTSAFGPSRYFNPAQLFIAFGAGSRGFFSGLWLPAATVK